MPDLLSSETFKRLQEYRVDFAYSAKVFSFAADRLFAEEQNEQNKKKWLDIVGIIIDVFTLSGIAFLYSEIYKNAAIVVLGVLSLASIGISLYTTLHQTEKLSGDYKRRANDYRSLYKQCKNIEAAVKDQLLTMEDLSKQVSQLHNAQIQITETKLLPNSADYEKAKKAIEEGQYLHTDEDLKKT